MGALVPFLSVTLCAEPITETVRVAIENVAKTPMESGDRFVVHATSAEKSWQFETFNAWIATLCERAKHQQRYVNVTYRKLPRLFGFWMPRIVRAEFEEIAP